MKRKIFSQKDGTKIGEDLKEIYHEVIDKLVRKYGDDAEKIIDFLKMIDEQIKEGTETDLIIDKVLSLIPGHANEDIYKFIQDNIGDFISFAEDIIPKITDPFDFETEDLLKAETAEYESMRHKTASILLQDYLSTKGEAIERYESDTAIQTVYFLKK